MLGLIKGTSGLPLRALHDHSVPFAICTDNPARCKTSMTEELFRVAKAFGYSDDDLLCLMLQAIDHAFADDSTRQQVRRELELAWGSYREPKAAIS